MMEEKLGKLVEYTIPGDGQCIVVSDSKSRMYTRYDPPMEFLASNAGFEMALLRLETFFSFPNIDSSNNCIRISIDSGKNWLDLKIPIGSYDIDGINEALQRLLPNKGNDTKPKEPYVVLSGNKYTLKCVLEITKDSTIVDFDTENSIQTVLGFEKNKYKGGKRYQSVWSQMWDIINSTFSCYVMTLSYYNSTLSYYNSTLSYYNSTLS